MKTLSDFRVNSPLTPEQYTALDTAAKQAALQTMIARRIAPTSGPYGFGKESIAFNKLEQMSGAQISYAWKVDASQDAVNFPRTILPLPVLSKSFRINYRQLEASRTNGTPIDTQNAKSAGYQVGLLEDQLVFHGYAADGVNVDIDGFYTGAGNSYTISKDFSTATNIPDAVNGAMALMLADNIAPPYNFTLNPVQYAETNTLIPNTQTSWRKWIQETIEGQVYMSPSVTAGTGLMSAAGDRGFFDLALGVDLTTLSEELGLDEGNDLFSVVFETAVPRIFDSNALCTLTNI
jgi:uncharacterized linocin/CFP29 family protein